MGFFPSFFPQIRSEQRPWPTSVAFFIPFKKKLQQCQQALYWELIGFPCNVKIPEFGVFFWNYLFWFFSQLCLLLIIFAAFCCRVGLLNSKPAKARIHPGKSSMGAAEGWIPPGKKGGMTEKMEKSPSQAVDGSVLLFPARLGPLFLSLHISNATKRSNSGVTEPGVLPDPWNAFKFVGSQARNALFSQKFPVWGSKEHPNPLEGDTAKIPDI